MVKRRVSKTKESEDQLNTLKRKTDREIGMESPDTKKNKECKRERTEGQKHVEKD